METNSTSLNSIHFWDKLKFQSNLDFDWSKILAIPSFYIQLEL